MNNLFKKDEDNQSSKEEDIQPQLIGIDNILENIDLHIDYNNIKYVYEKMINYYNIQ